MKRISIGSWAYSIGPYASHPVDWQTVTRTLKEYGFDGVELGGFPPHPNPDDLKTKDSRKKVGDALKQLGLSFSGLAANLWAEKLINTDNTGHYFQTFVQNCDFCNDLGIKTIRVDSVQPPTVFEQVDYDTGMKRVTDTWKRCAKTAAERGLAVSWEFEPGFAFNKPSQVLQVLEKVNEPNFGVMYDTCHGQMVAVVGARHGAKKETLPGGQREFIRKLDGKINHIHLIDSDNTCHKDANGNDETSTHAPFGDGVINFDEVIPALNKAARLTEDWWTIDLCFWPDAWPVTKRCKAAIDELNRKYG